MPTTTVTRVSITEDAPVQAQQTRRPTLAWWWLVAASVLVLVLVAAALLADWAHTRETRTTSYRVLGDLAGVHLDLGAADVEIDGGATAVEVKRIDEFAFGKPSVESHQVVDGTLNITSHCPEQVIGSCHASFRVTVPDNVPLEIETSSGSINLAGVRASVQLTSGSGDIGATGFCGFSFRAISDSGNLDVSVRVLGRPARAALAQRRRARDRPRRPLPDRRPERQRVHADARAHERRRRGLPDPGAERLGRRDRRGRVVTAALDISPHFRAARRSLLYLVIGLGQGLTYLIVLGGGLVLGVVLAPLWVGLPMLAGTARLAWRLAEGERRQANRLLDAHLPAIPPAPATRSVREQFRGGAVWRLLAILLLKLPTVLVGLVLAGAPALLAVGAGRARDQRHRGR